MISKLLSYSGIITKTKAMEAHLIRFSDYEKIASLGSLSDFVLFLKNIPGYRELFDGIDENTIHRSQIEDILVSALYRDYSKLFRFAGKEQKHALAIIFFRYEVNILKTCLKQIFDSSSQLDLSAFKPFFSRHSKLDLERLSQVHAIEELLSELKDTEYGSLFHTLAQNETFTLWDCELSLDIYYYTKAWKMCQALLKGPERKSFQDTLGKQIDLLNLMWIYRSKKYYHMETVTIYASLIPIYYKLNSKQITAMVEASTLEEFINIFRSTPYYTPGESSFSVETTYNKLLDKAYLDSKRKNQVSMSTLFNYLHLKEREIDRLTTSLECIRYQLEPSATLKYIIQ